MATLGSVTLTVVVDRAALDKARETLAAELNGTIADPAVVAEVVDRIIRTGPIVRYVMAPARYELRDVAREFDVDLEEEDRDCG